MPKTNEWNLLKRQFDELVRDDSDGTDSIELDDDLLTRFGSFILITTRSPATLETSEFGRPKSTSV